jgi:hypothetical protein
MASIIYTAVNLYDKTSGAVLGIIRFDASGRLDYLPTKEAPESAFQSIEDLLSEQWLKEPLYQRYASRLDESGKIPDEILVREADSCADFLNSLETPPMLSGHAVKARKIFSIIKSP